MKTMCLKKVFQLHLQAYWLTVVSIYINAFDSVILFLGIFTTGFPQDTETFLTTVPQFCTQAAESNWRKAHK